MTQCSATRSLVLAIALLGAAPGHAVIITTGDGTGNTTAPADDPGWANVGTLATGSLTVIYLGNGWVLTAAHVGAGDVILAGRTYSAISGSEQQLVNPDSTLADLLLFRINGFPPLPYLTIAWAPPTTTEVATLIGNGVNRGAATSWMGIGGFLWGSGNTLRWGTAEISQVGGNVTINGITTQTLQTLFTNGGTPFPAQAAVGDSGGAAFVKVSGTWMLAGVLIAVDEYNGQPAGTSLFGTHTYAADLSYYRGQIVPVVTPGCGLGGELAFLMPPLLWFHARRRRRTE